MIKNYAGKNDLVFFTTKKAMYRSKFEKPYGLTINMDRDDVSVAAIVYPKG